MVTHGYITRCVGKWVICQTRRNQFIGRVAACGGDHVVFHIPQGQGYPISMDMDGTTDFTQLGTADITSSPDSDLVWYGVGNVLVPLAAIVGLTIIGASAIYW